MNVTVESSLTRLQSEIIYYCVIRVNFTAVHYKGTDNTISIYNSFLVYACS